jgi:hypothetical protein
MSQRLAVPASSIPVCAMVAVWFAGASGCSGRSSNDTHGAGGGDGSGATTSTHSAGGDSVSSGGGTSTAGTRSAGGDSVGSGGTALPGGEGGVAESGGLTATGGKSSSVTGGRPSGVGGTRAAGGRASDGGTVPAAGALGEGGSMAAAGTIEAGGKASTGGSPGQGATTAAGGTIGTGGAGGGAGIDGSGTGGSTGTGGSCAPPTVELTGTDAVANGPLITFDDVGSWNWFQDERAVVDVENGKLVVGSVAVNGSRQGDIEAVIYDLASGEVGPPSKLGNLSVDEYNAPALVVGPNGKYVAVWAGHRTDCNTYYSIYDGSAWSEQMTFDWTEQGCPWDGDSTHMVTYSNVWFMDGELFDIARSVGTSPNLLSSSDSGATWSYCGRLTTATPTVYVAGYYKYWGNNTDRIDFVGNEAHPRDLDTSLYSGYIQGGAIFKSTGGVRVDDALADGTAHDITEFTPVFKTGNTVGDVVIRHAWIADLVRYRDGSLGLIWTGRAGTGGDNSNPDLRLLYGRFDGSSWKLTYLGKAGPKLYPSEEDYTGVGALHPDDPTTLFISTPYDPSDETTAPARKHEIWRGTTCDGGTTFQWTPVTANSSSDNIRPIVPKWDGEHTALLWLRGDFRSVSAPISSVVGTVTRP